MLVRDLEVHVVEIREEHLVLGGARDLAPVLVRLVLDEPLVAEEDRLVRHLTPSIHEPPLPLPLPLPRSRCLDGAAAARAELHEVARVDPVGVLNLGVIGPDPRPLIGVPEVGVADAPERVALPDDVLAGRLAAPDAGASEKDGAVLGAVGGAVTAGRSEVERVLLFAGDGVGARLRGVPTSDGSLVARRRHPVGGDDGGRRRGSALRRRRAATGRRGGALRALVPSRGRRRRGGGRRLRSGGGGVERPREERSGHCHP